MFIAVLFTVAETWKLPKCPLTEDWINIWHMCTMEYYSAFKKNELMPFATTWTDLESVILSKASQIEKEKYCVAFHYMWNLKINDTNELTK